MEMTSPHKFEYNGNEISITAIERKSILLGFLRASEQHLIDLQSIPNPNYVVKTIKQKLRNDLKEIRKEYGQYDSQ
jgi:hypothetical protein